MIGSEISPMAMTEAATVPVMAPSTAPTRITAYARPPRAGPNNCPNPSSKSSARPQRSKIAPMKVKNGIASSSSFDMMPKTRSGIACNNATPKKPCSMAITAKTSPTADSEKATG